MLARMERKQKTLTLAAWVGGMVFLISVLIVLGEIMMGLELSVGAVVNMIIGGFLVQMQQFHATRLDMLRILEHLSDGQQ